MKRLTALPVIKPALILLDDHHVMALALAGVAAYLAAFVPAFAPHLQLILILLFVGWLSAMYFLNRAAGTPINVFAQLQQIVSDLQNTSVSKDDLQAALQAALKDLFGTQPQNTTAAPGGTVIATPARTFPATNPQLTVDALKAVNDAVLSKMTPPKGLDITLPPDAVVQPVKPLPPTVPGYVQPLTIRSVAAPQGDTTGAPSGNPKSGVGTTQADANSVG